MSNEGEHERFLGGAVRSGIWDFGFWILARVVLLCTRSQCICDAYETVVF